MEDDMGTQDSHRLLPDSDARIPGYATPNQPSSANLGNTAPDFVDTNFMPAGKQLGIQIPKSNNQTWTLRLPIVSSRDPTSRRDSHGPGSPNASDNHSDREPLAEEHGGNSPGSPWSPSASTPLAAHLYAEPPSPTSSSHSQLSSSSPCVKNTYLNVVPNAQGDGTRQHIDPSKSRFPVTSRRTIRPRLGFARSGSVKHAGTSTVHSAIGSYMPVGRLTEPFQEGVPGKALREPAVTVADLFPVERPPSGNVLPVVQPLPVKGLIPQQLSSELSKASTTFRSCYRDNLGDNAADDVPQSTWNLIKTLFSENINIFSARSKFEPLIVTSDRVKTFEEMGCRPAPAVLSKKSRSLDKIEQPNNLTEAEVPKSSISGMYRPDSENPVSKSPHVTKAAARGHFFHPYFPEDTVGPVPDTYKRTHLADTSSLIIAITAATFGTLDFTRFPYFLYYYNGISFLLAYIIIGYFVIQPVMCFFIAMGQILQGSQSTFLESISPRTRGLMVGAAAMFILGASQQSVDMSYLMWYMYYSVRPHLPWRVTPEEAQACEASSTVQCALAGPVCGFNLLNGQCAIDEIRFANSYYASVSTQMGPVVTFTLLTLIWFAVLFALTRGYNYLFGLGVWTISVRVVVLCFLFAFGASLKGAAYVMNLFFETSRLLDWWADPYIWSFAITQTVIAYSIATPVLATLAALSPPSGSVVRIAQTVYWLNTITSALVGFALYPYLGFVRERTSSYGLMGLAARANTMMYTLFPFSLSNLPGPQVFCLLFFFTLISAVGGALAAQFVAFTDTLSTWRLFSRFPRIIVGVIVVAVPLGVTLASIRNSVATGEMTRRSDSAASVGYVAISLLIILFVCWLNSIELQVQAVGFVPVCLVTGGYLLFLTSVALLGLRFPTEPERVLRGIALSFTVTLTLWLIAACFGAYRMRRRDTKMLASRDTKLDSRGTTRSPLESAQVLLPSYRKYFNEVAWWTLVGNMEILRASINEIVVGPLPVDQSIRAKKQYGGTCCSGRVKMRWALQMKFLAPALLTYALVYQWNHINGHGATDADYGIHVFTEIFSDATIQESYKYHYALVILGPLLLTAAGLIVPKLFAIFAPARRVTYLRAWRGAYELTTKQFLVSSLRETCRELSRVRNNWSTMPQGSPAPPKTRAASAIQEDSLLRGRKSSGYGKRASVRTDYAPNALGLGTRLASTRATKVANKQKSLARRFWFQRDTIASKDVNSLSHVRDMPQRRITLTLESSSRNRAVHEGSGSLASSKHEWLRKNGPHNISVGSNRSLGTDRKDEPRSELTFFEATVIRRKGHPKNSLGSRRAFRTVWRLKSKLQPARKRARGVSAGP